MKNRISNWLDQNLKKSYVDEEAKHFGSVIFFFFSLKSPLKKFTTLNIAWLFEKNGFGCNFNNML